MSVINTETHIETQSVSFQDGGYSLGESKGDGTGDEIFNYVLKITLGLFSF